MLGKQNSAAEQPERISLSTSFAARNSEPYPAPHEPLVSPAPLKSRPWLPRLAQLFKDLIGEPSNTTLPDLNQENP